MNKNNLFLGGLGVVVVLLLIFVLTNISKLNSDEQSISPNILSITLPVYSFYGKAESINGNTLTVTQNLASYQPMLPPAANPSGSIPTPKITPVIYSVLVTNTTQISKLTKIINPNTVDSSLQEPKLTISDIAVDQLIIIYTTEDLRTLKGTTFEATSINLP